MKRFMSGFVALAMVLPLGMTGHASALLVFPAAEPY